MISSIRIPKELEMFPQLVKLLSEFVSLIYKRQVLGPSIISILSSQMTEIYNFADANLDDSELTTLQKFVDALVESNEQDSI